MHSRFALWASVLALSLLLPSYTGRVELARIAVSGCEQLNRGGICELKNAQDIVVWHAGSQQLEAYDPDARAWLPYAGEPAATGSLYRVPVRAEQARLWLRFSGRTNASARAHQVLRLKAAPSWPWQKQIEAADNVTARELLEARLASARRDERAFVLYELARREYRTAQRAQGAKHLQEAAALAEELGRTSLARSCLSLLANHASAAHDFAASKAALERAEQLAGPAHGVIDAYGQALIGNARGTLAAELAALHDAVKAYEDARSWVERGAFALGGHVLNGLAMVSVLQGRLWRAHELYARLSDGDQARGDACFRAITLGNLGWVELELLRAQAGGASTSADATRHLRESVEHFSRCRATASWRPAHARLSLAYDALRRGDLGAARQGIDAAGTFDDEPRMAQYRSLLAAELLLAEGRAGAAAEGFAALYSQLQPAPSTEPAWRALDGHGRALAAQQRWSEAIERFEAAEQLLAHAARGVPDPSALTSFFGTHDHSARGLREAHLAAGQSELAFRALRRAQRRHLLALARDQRVWQRATDAEWQRAYAAVLQKRAELTELVRRTGVAPDTERAAAERGVAEQRSALEAAQTQLLALLGHDALAEDERLRAPRPGELIVAWLRDEQGLSAYAAFGAETRHTRYAQLPDERGYLEPFADWLAQAREVSVLSFSEPQSLDVHKLPFRGAPLIEHVPVAYSLDLPPRAADSQSAHDVALLATDRAGNLVYAQRELDALKRVLGQHGWKVSELSELSELQSPRAHAESKRESGAALGMLAQSGPAAFELRATDAHSGSLLATTESRSAALEQRTTDETLLATTEGGAAAHEQRALDAQSGAVLARLDGRPALFYYAGHGRVDESGALRSALALSEAELTVADILALRAPPARVVLSACEAARTPDLREAVGISLAQAFVLAGSDEVLAPARAVSDRAAELLSMRVREGLARREPLAILYQSGLRDARASAELDAYAFRRVVP